MISGWMKFDFLEKGQRGSFPVPAHYHRPSTNRCMTASQSPSFSTGSGALWTLGSGDSRSYDSNGEKPSQPGFARGNAPLLPPAAASPPEGEILAVL